MMSNGSTFVNKNGVGEMLILHKKEISNQYFISSFHKIIFRIIKVMDHLETIKEISRETRFFSIVLDVDTGKWNTFLKFIDKTYIKEISTNELSNLLNDTDSMEKYLNYCVGWSK